MASQRADDLALAVQSVTKRFRSKGGAVVAADDVSFGVARGEVVGILGANGAGKTTTVKSICGLIRPSSGDVLVEGISVTRNRHRALRYIAAVLEGNRNVYWRLTVDENLRYFAALAGVRWREVQPLADRVIADFELDRKRATPARMLSRGMQQKLAVACALVRGSSVLLLDEPTLGLDVQTARSLRSSIQGAAESGTAVLLSTHDMRLAEAVCSRVVILAGGRVVADDTVRNLLRLFSVQAYDFEFLSPLSSSGQAAFGERFPSAAFAPTEGGSAVHVEFIDPSDLYHAMDFFRAEGCVISSIAKGEPDLEEVLLSLSRGEAAT